MKRVYSISITILLILVLAAPAAASLATYTGIPTFSIVSVVADKTVTIQTYNFPANVSFQVLMGAYGTLGIGGIAVETTDSGAGGSFSKTYSIPAALAGSSRIAIRLESKSTGYFAYNWFYNSGGTSATPTPGGPTPIPGYVGYPTFSIVSVVRDSTVTIQGVNFPANDTFNVRMGVYGTLGIGGILVDTTGSGSGGTLSKTYSIPSALAGSAKIAIRLESPTTGYFAYNWFYNNSTGTVGPTPTPGGPTPIPGYVGIPTFSISAVVKDNSVTILTKNFPPNDTFTVRMGAYGTLGIGGIIVDTTSSGTGGSFSKTYTIPSALAGSAKIAIRLESSSSGYFAYNWFYNNTYP